MGLRLIQQVQSKVRRSRLAPASLPVCRKPQRLQLETLENREVPAIGIQLDYSYDAGGFFNDPSRRAILQQAANDVAGNLNANLPAIVPGGGNNWAQTFYNPGTGQQTTINNPIIGANTLVIYVGGRGIGGAEAGFGGSGGYSGSGTQGWLNSLAARGPGGSLLWGGSMTFSTNANWFFGASTSGIDAYQVDFYSVAAHELGHVLGIGTSPRWFSQSSGGYFTGAASRSVYGGPVPLSPDAAHWADGVNTGGVGASLDPTLQTGKRVTLSSLDYAGLTDLGWSVGGGSGGTSPVVPPSPPPPPVAPVPVGSSLLQGTNLVVLTGPTDGSAQVFTSAPDGTLSAAGPRFFPFYGYAGVIRSTIADFNGDGKVDFAFGTGNGVGATIRIISGATGTDLVGPTSVFSGFAGGVFLAAGDVDRDGKAELVISADMGGGPRVTVFKVQSGSLNVALDFIAFDNPAFRGGSRVSMADVNRDGAADLIIGAGIGGGPRVSIYDGTSLLSGHQNRLVPDFFALDPALRSGVYVTSADVDGDGYSDILYSTGNSGGPRIRVVSGYMLVTNPGANVANLPALADFYALDANDRSGLRITARDLDRDGKAELIIASGARDFPTVRVIPLSQMNIPTAPLQNPFGDPTTIDGIFVG